MKFPIGQTVVTQGVANMLSKNSDFAQFVTNSINRHIKGDWGDLCDEDKHENEVALKDGYRLFSKYVFNDDVSIYIITEYDRSVTTILFPEEY